MNKLKGKDFVSLEDFSRKELMNILETAHRLKVRSRPGAQVQLLKGRTLAMIFERPSTRTRVSMEAAMTQLGGHAQYLDIKTMHYGGSMEPGVSAMPAGGEPLTDTYRVLATYAEGIYHRTTYQSGSHKAMVEGASLVNVPVINACDDYEHPCQIMANLMTIREKKRKFEDLKLVYCGIAQECHSFLWSAPKLGINMTIVLPEGCDSVLDKRTLDEAKSTAQKNGCNVDVNHDLFEAAHDADVVYNSGGNNVFLSANPKLTKEDLEEKFTVNKEVMKRAKPAAIYMHSMPARRRPYYSWNEGGVTDDVIQGPHSVSVDLAENRMHSAKGILVSIIP